MLWEVEILPKHHDPESERVRQEVALLTHQHAGDECVDLASRGFLLEGIFPLAMADANLLSRVNSFMCSSASFDFGSNVSIWLGPPSMRRKMQALALAAAIGALAASAPARARSCASSAVNANPPNP